jgi:hypothetical protein
VAVSDQDRRGVPMPRAVLLAASMSRSTSRSVRYSRPRLPLLHLPRLEPLREAASFPWKQPPAYSYCYRFKKRCNRPGWIFKLSARYCRRVPWLDRICRARSSQLTPINVSRCPLLTQSGHCSITSSPGASNDGGTIEAKRASI